MNLKHFLLITSIIVAQLLVAQDEDNRTAVGIYLTKSEYRGDLGNSLWNFNTSFNLGGALSLQQFITPSFDIGIHGEYGRYNYPPMGGRKYETFAFANYKLNNGYIFNKNSIVSPFLSGGLGFAGYHSGNIPNKGLDFIFPLGAGIKIHLTEDIALEYKYLLYFTNNDSRDNIAPQHGTNDRYGQHFAGISISFGGVDSDNDGVKNSKDLCPNTPLGILVNKNGCPLDSDNDGVPDYLDQCPSVPGLKLLNGCPDTDGDGVPDPKDQCPNTPENVQVNKIGCPQDTDNDGVPDYLDQCPNVYGIAKFNGCPDTDGDGISDFADKCPDVAGATQFGGCPDTDGDGIPDNADRCPDVAGTIANKGCPEITNEVTSVLKQALYGIQFDTNSDIIKSNSYTVLNKVVEVLNNNPTYNLTISGHTDGQGNDQHNQKLSERRAESVKKYLMDKGVESSRLIALGFGESKPIATNTTSKGRYLNRRVELEVTF